MDKKLSVIVADDHPAVRDGIESALKKNARIKEVRFAATGPEVISLLEKSISDIVFMDYKMPGMNGDEATHLVAEKFPGTKVIAVSAFEVEDIISAMLSAGAHGFLLKSAKPAEFNDAIDFVLSGRRYYSPEVLAIMERRMKHDNILGTAYGNTIKLTPAETEILLLRCKGKTNSEIAALRFTELSTVEKHMHNVCEKIEEHTESGYIRYACRTRLITSVDFFSE